VGCGKLWHERDEQWQTRCAQILSHGEQGHAVKLLMDIVMRGEPEARVAAVDSMRENALEKLSSLDREYLLSEVKQHMTNASVTEAAVLKVLLLRLKK
jgi:hypothetical protein